jgi:hypothetical protein
LELAIIKINELQDSLEAKPASINFEPVNPPKTRSQILAELTRRRKEDARKADEKATVDSTDGVISGTSLST